MRSHGIEWKKENRVKCAMGQLLMSRAPLTPEHCRALACKGKKSSMSLRAASKCPANTARGKRGRTQRYATLIQSRIFLALAVRIANGTAPSAAECVEQIHANLAEALNNRTAK